MTSKLVLDLTNPDVADACGACEVGEERNFTSVTGKCTAKTDTTATFEVTDLEYSDPDSESDAEEAKESPAVEAAEDDSGAPPAKPKKKMKPAVAAAAGNDI